MRLLLGDGSRYPGTRAHQFQREPGRSPRSARAQMRAEFDNAGRPAAAGPVRASAGARAAAAAGVPRTPERRAAGRKRPFRVCARRGQPPPSGRSRSANGRYRLDRALGAEGRRSRRPRQPFQDAARRSPTTSSARLRPLLQGGPPGAVSGSGLGLSLALETPACTAAGSAPGPARGRRRSRSSCPHRDTVVTRARRVRHAPTRAWRHATFRFRAARRPRRRAVLGTAGAAAAVRVAVLPRHRWDRRRWTCRRSPGARGRRRRTVPRRHRRHSGLNRGTRRAFLDAQAAMAAQGLHMTLTFGYRSPAEQAELYRQAIAKYGSPERPPSGSCRRRSRSTCAASRSTSPRRTPLGGWTPTVPRTVSAARWNGSGGTSSTAPAGARRGARPCDGDERCSGRATRPITTARAPICRRRRAARPAAARPARWPAAARAGAGASTTAPTMRTARPAAATGTSPVATPRIPGRTTPAAPRSSRTPMVVHAPTPGSPRPRARR